MYIHVYAYVCGTDPMEPTPLVLRVCVHTVHVYACAWVCVCVDDCGHVCMLLVYVSICDRRVYNIHFIYMCVCKTFDY